MRIQFTQDVPAASGQRGYAAGEVRDLPEASAYYYLVRGLADTTIDARRLSPPPAAKAVELPPADKMMRPARVRRKGATEAAAKAAGLTV